MKKTKLIGIGVATFGIALSVGVSLALYVHKDADKQIGIGVFTPHVSGDGDINYAVDTIQASNSNAAFSPDHLENNYSFRLGASKGEDSRLPLQKYTVGDLSIVISSTNATLINNLAATAEVAVPTGKWQDKVDDNAQNPKNSDGKIELAAATKDVTSETKTLTLTLTNFTAQTEKDVTGGVNSIVSLKLALANNLAEATVLGLAGATYNIDVTWVAPADFTFAYITGTQYAWSTADNDTRMVPNALANSFEWMYTGYTDNTPGESRGAKCIKEAVNPQTSAVYTVWSGGSDQSINLNTAYDVYWNGSGDSTATFSAQQA